MANAQGGESSESRDLERRFAARIESAAAARRFVEGALTGTRVDRDDAMLLTSELVNNAIIHAQGDFDVRVTITDGKVRVAVVNHAPELLLFAREPSTTGGRGLALIDGIAASWGFERQSETKLVWFCLAVSPRAAELVGTGSQGAPGETATGQ